MDPWRDPGEYAVSQAAADVLAERERQKARLGWTPEHDDTHTDNSISRAAAAYALDNSYIWPWNGGFKPEGHRRNLVKAGALILAEIERLDRIPL